MLDPRQARITLAAVVNAARGGERFAMLTAYDHPTAVRAQAAGVPVLLVGDSLGNVILGQETTRGVPLDLIVTLAEAVRRGAPHAWLVGDIPFVAMEAGPDAVSSAARRFRDQAGCDAVKLETAATDAETVTRLVDEGCDVIAHLGLRPQAAVSRDQLRAQARDPAGIDTLVADCRTMVARGACMLLLEAVPNEASSAVVEAVDVPVIGCGGGTACHGHVVVTHDMLGIGTGQPPRFVPVLASIGDDIEAAMRRYVDDIASGAYPAPEHVYGMRKTTASS